MAVASTVACLSLPGAASAQGNPAAYPAKPVTLILPLAAGGPVDVETRVYSTKLTEMTGQPFLVDYKLGAAGTIAGAYVAKAAPDGYTVLVVNGAFTTFPALYTNLSFDVLKDFAPVSLASKRGQLLLVSPSFPAKTYAEYIAYARANPGKINLGTTGAGSGTHLAGAWLHSATNTRVTFVHYKGTGPLLPDLMAGRIDVTVAAVPPTLQLIKSGKLRALAMMGDRRTSFLPDLPTVAEMGVPGYDYSGYTGFFAPGATPPALVARLNEVFVKAVKSPDVSSRLEADGNIMVGSTPAQFRQMLVTEAAVWRKVVDENGIKLEE